MQKTNFDPAIRPADRLSTVNEYYFSRKGKQVAQMLSLIHISEPTRPY